MATHNLRSNTKNAEDAQKPRAANEQLFRDFNIELQDLDFCIPGCTVFPTNRCVPMIPCGLCDRWFHYKCLGFENWPTPAVRGLYLCQTCLAALKELRLLSRPQQELEARLEALEALVVALDVEHSLLRERLNHKVANIKQEDQVIRIGTQVVNTAYASLLRENAELKRELVNVTQINAKQRALDAKKKEILRRRDFDAMITIQRRIYAKAHKEINPKNETLTSKNTAGKKQSDPSLPGSTITTGAFEANQKVDTNGVLSRSHMRRPFKCELCPADFTRDAHLQRHQLNLHKVDSRRRIRNRSNIGKREHVSTEQMTGNKASSGNYARCEHCKELFVSQGFLLHHLKLRHPKHYEQKVCPYACKFCGQKFMKANTKYWHENRACKMGRVGVANPSDVKSINCLPSEVRQESTSLQPVDDELHDYLMNDAESSEFFPMEGGFFLGSEGDPESKAILHISNEQENGELQQELWAPLCLLDTQLDHDALVNPYVIPQEQPLDEMQPESGRNQKDSLED